jgi:hypothetical protein
VQITPVVPAGEKISQAAADQARTIDRVFNGEGSNDSQVCEEVRAEMSREAFFVTAAEVETALQPILAT